MTLAGCAPDDAPSGAAGVVVLDEERGEIRLPIDEYIPQRTDSGLLASASQAMAVGCAREAGISFMAPAPIENEIYRSEGLFGPWTTWQAEKFGFVSPTLSDADLREGGVVPEDYGVPGDPAALAQVLEVNDAMSAADQEAVLECYDAPGQKAFRLPSGPGPWLAEFGAADERARTSEAVVAARAELDDCLRREGLEPDPETFVVGADENVIDEEQIGLAVTYVACKQETRFTETVAQVFADEQAQVVEKYDDDLAAVAAELVTVREAAREYVADHPEVFEPPQ
ncbi:hypothetical protein [Sediminihabitans luteus]|uniref:hypothetical protein n=1 Tax=Sediminihabitans luteus TaxID=1138585 RepID=UPI0012FE314C|nr:hypothetical protein [Sediminihabitans luteus]